MISENIAHSYEEAQHRALIAAHTHLVELVKIFESDGCLDDYDFEEVANTAVEMEIAYPNVTFVATLEDPPEDEGGETDDAYALTSAGRGTDEDHGDMPL